MYMYKYIYIYVINVNVQGSAAHYWQTCILELNVQLSCSGWQKCVPVLSLKYSTALEYLKRGTIISTLNCMRRRILRTGLEEDWGLGLGDVYDYWLRGGLGTGNRRTLCRDYCQCFRIPETPWVGCRV